MPRDVRPRAPDSSQIAGRLQLPRGPGKERRAPGRDAHFGDAHFGDAHFGDAHFGDADFGDADFGDADF